MKYPNIILLLISFCLISCESTTQQDFTEKVKPEFQTILDSFQLKGSILVYDHHNKTYYSNDFVWSQERNLPASTFKIPNSIIALELGIIQSDSSLIKWNGEDRRLDIWEQDMSFKEAFQLSCVPCYQEIAKNIGVERMRKYLDLFDYQEMIFDSSSIDNFWLEGDSKISQFEQIDFLKKFYFSELPVSERTVNLMKNIFEVEKTANYTFSGKTGWGVRSGKNNGWYVGFLETQQNVYFFAINVVPKEGLEIKNFMSARMDVTKAALKELNLMN